MKFDVHVFYTNHRLSTRKCVEFYKLEQLKEDFSNFRSLYIYKSQPFPNFSSPRKGKRTKCQNQRFRSYTQIHSTRRIEPQLLSFVQSIFIVIIVTKPIYKTRYKHLSYHPPINLRYIVRVIRSLSSRSRIISDARPKRRKQMK